MFMKKLFFTISVISITFLMTSCYSLEHTVGTGAQGNTTKQQKQWYALWGAVPINKVDSKKMAGDAQNYTIKSQHKFLDYIISGFTACVSITVQTVEVSK